VSKIEIFFVVLIVLLFFFEPSLIKQKDQKAKKSQKIEIEAEKFISYEINQSGIKDKLVGKKAIKYPNRWVVKDLVYNDSKIKRCTSKEGIAKGNTLILNGKVHIIKVNGAIYNANYAIYNRLRKILKTKGYFDVTDDKNFVKGYNLFYDMKKGIARAKRVYGRFVVKD